MRNHLPEVSMGCSVLYLETILISGSAVSGSEQVWIHYANFFCVLLQCELDCFESFFLCTATM